MWRHSVGRYESPPVTRTNHPVHPVVTVVQSVTTVVHPVITEAHPVTTVVHPVTTVVHVMAMWPGVVF